MLVSGLCIARKTNSIYVDIFLPFGEKRVKKLFRVETFF